MDNFMDEFKDESTSTTTSIKKSIKTSVSARRGAIKKILAAIASVVALIVIFYAGFYTARSMLSGAPTATASNDVDFSPFWKVWDLIDEKYIPATTTEATSDQERVWGAIQGMVDSLNDPYTVFLPPAENDKFETTIQGEFTGVGMEVGIRDGQLTVISPLKGTPADESGIEAQDVILFIDEIPTIDMTIDEAVDLIRGPVGTAVSLTVLRDGLDESFDIEIVRDVIVIPTIETEIVGDREDIFLISLYNFSANATTEFRAALREFIVSRKKKLILDLRGNPGGFLDASVDIASWFLPAGKVIVREDFGDDEKVFRSKGYDIFTEQLQMVVLVNGGSASASEILAGALKEHGVATVVGSQTFGKGSVQELLRVTPETALKVTVARWLTPNGNSISDGGLTPDIIIDAETVEVTDETPLYELQMKKAIEILK